MSSLKIPATGWQTVGEPCAECLLILNRESATMTFPGRSVSCYACENKMTAIGTEKEGPSIQDRYSSEGNYQEFTKEIRLVELLFQRSSHTNYGMEQWIERNELESFERSGSKGVEWDVFTKTADTEATIFVHLHEGIIGRCVLDVATV